jgi:hypothetical protein
VAFTTKLLGWLRGELHHFLGRYQATLARSNVSVLFQLGLPTSQAEGAYSCKGDDHESVEPLRPPKRAS